MWSVYRIVWKVVIKWVKYDFLKIAIFGIYCEDRNQTAFMETGPYIFNCRLRMPPASTGSAVEGHIRTVRSLDLNTETQHWWRGRWVDGTRNRCSGFTGKLWDEIEEVYFGTECNDS